MLQQQITAFQNVGVDPQALAVQRENLSRFNDVANAGYTATERASINAMQNQQMSKDRGNRLAILQNMAARGVSGSGAELAARLSNQQSGANIMNQAGLTLDATAKANALQAVVDQSKLARSVGNQINVVNKQRATAQDQINYFNTNQENISRKYNLDLAYKAAQDRQNVNNANDALTTQQNAQPAAIAQARFNNAKAVAAGAGNVASAKATNLQNAENTRAENNRKLLGAVAAVGGRIYASPATATAAAAGA